MTRSYPKAQLPCKHPALLAKGMAPALLALGIIASSSAEAAATESIAPKCRFCVFESGYSGHFETGFGLLSGDGAFNFGDYTGLDDTGLTLIAGASARWREEDGAGYWDAQLSDLGLDSRRIEIDGGAQGLWAASLSFDELPRRLYDRAETPFYGVSRTDLQLPAGWTSGASTMAMPDLASSLNPLDLRQERKRLAAALSFKPAASWGSSLQVRRDVRRGNRLAGASFITMGSQFPLPVDSSTDQLELSTHLNGRKWQAVAGYYGSFFHNDHEALSWQNPYTPLVDGGDFGRLALAPDNQFHQLSFGGGYQPLRRLRLNAHLAGGLMRQDETYLPATINPNLMVALPATSLEGKVNTLNARLRASMGPWSGLRFNAAYAYNDRNNRTQQHFYTPVLTDVLATDPRRNLPYSFTHNSAKLGATYRYRSLAQLSGGWEQDWRSRSYAARARVEESKLWMRLRLDPPGPVSVSGEYALSSRRGSSFRAPEEGRPLENPLLRQYHLANRERDTAALTISVNPVVWLSADVSTSYGHDRYKDTELGLKSRRRTGYGANLSLRPEKRLSLTAFWSQDNLHSEQAGSQSFAQPDWQAENRDLADSAGLRLDRKSVFGKYDVGIAYEFSRSRGETEVSANAASPAFPDLSSRRQELQLYSLIPLRPKLNLRIDYRYAHYRSRDWAIDGVMADSISNILWTGQTSPSYDVQLIIMSLRYEFK